MQGGRAWDDRLEAGRGCWGARPADQLVPIPGSDAAPPVPRGSPGGQTSNGNRRPWGPEGRLQAGRRPQQGGGARSHQAGEPRGLPQAAVAARGHRPLPPPLLANPALTLSVSAAARPPHCTVRPAAAGRGGPRSVGAHAGGVQVRRYRNARRRLACGWTQPQRDAWCNSRDARCQLAHTFCSARPARRSSLTPCLVPAGPCCLPPLTCCARGAAMATRPPPF